MNKGFLNKLKYVRLDRDVINSLDIINNGNKSIKIKSNSRDIKILTSVIEPSDVIQTIHFVVSVDKKDIDLNYKIYFDEYNNDNIVDIKFYSDKDRWTISSNDLEYGKINTFELFKNTFVKSNIKIFLIEGSDKREIKKNGDKISFFVKKNIDYSILIKEGVYKQEIKLSNEKVISDDVLDFEISSKYKKGKAIFKFVNNTPMSKDLEINITGDITNKKILRRGYSEFFIEELVVINTYKSFMIYVNNKPYSVLVCNPDFFPSDIVKTNNGVRLNKTCKESLIIKTEDKETKVLPGTKDINMIWEGVKEFELLFNNVSLCKRKLNYERDLPKLYLLSNPMRIKLSKKSLQEIIVKFKGSDRKIIIPSGTVEYRLQGYSKGVISIDIDYVENASPDKKSYKLLS
jgi:hypothetical protein